MKYKVCVHCITYNQKEYVIDTLVGFIKQVTNFPFVCCIIDDASTDGEQEIIRDFVFRNFDVSTNHGFYEKEKDYGKVIYARHKTNHNCYFAVIFLKENHFSKGKSKGSYFSEWNKTSDYIATCEGDDYWIDNSKLQKQSNFLDCNPDVSLCCHQYKILIQNTGEVYRCETPLGEYNPKQESFLFMWEDLSKYGWITKTLTLLYRKSMIDPQFFSQFKIVRDVHLVLCLLQNGKGCFQNFIGGVYRINDKSIFGCKSNIEKRRQNYIVYKEIYDVMGWKPDLNLRASYALLFFNRIPGFKKIHSFFELRAIIYDYPIYRIRLLLKKIIRLFSIK